MTEEEREQTEEGQAEEAEEPAAEEPAAEEPAAEEPAAEEAPAEEPAAEEPAAEEAPADEAAVEPALAEPEEEEEELSPKERRRRERARASGPPRPSRSPEERAAERAERRRTARERRRRYRQRRRERRGAPGSGTQPAERERPPAPKVRQGTVISSRADKTITVRIEIVRRHPMYEKVVRRSRTVHAHDERNEASEGDTVRVVESRPRSRTKRWRLLEIVERAPARAPVPAVEEEVAAIEEEGEAA